MWLAIFFYCLGFNQNIENASVTSFQNQTVVFQYDYVNFAWGKQHAGWYIDTEGNVYAYKNPTQWKSFDPSGKITDIDMKFNLQKSRILSYKVDVQQLKSKLKLAENAAKGGVSNPVNKSKDAGSTIFYGMSYDSKSKTYKSFILKQIGDFEITNQSKQADELYKWMQSIKSEIDKNSLKNK